MSVRFRHLPGEMHTTTKTCSGKVVLKLGKTVTPAGSRVTAVGLAARHTFNMATTLTLALA